MADDARGKFVLEKYGPNIRGILDGSGSACPLFASSWWRDVVNLDRGGDTNWFNEEVVRKVHMLIRVFGMWHGGGITFPA
jgi:ethanolamine utilization protein EutA (predicted chaperonin)